MALWALLPGIPAIVLAFAIGAAVHLGVGASAAIGGAVAVGGFCAQVLALGAARKVSPTANQAMAYVGFLLLIALVVAAFFSLKAAATWFSPKAFAGGLLALVPVTFYEAFQARRGRIAEVILDADRAATAARHGGPA